MTRDTPARIVVLGSANMDLVLRPSRMPRPGETVMGDDFTTTPGGKGLNQAIAAARAGARVEFIGAVGRDTFGEQLREALLADAVDVSRLERVDAPTGVAVVSVLEAGENSIVVVAGANGARTAFTDAASPVAEATHLLVQLERPIPVVRDALARARAGGITSILTPAPIVDGALALVGSADIVVPNTHEARLLAGTEDELAAARILSEMGPTVVMTRGERGALIARAGSVVVEVPARPVRAVDTTGAGDTFTGVMAARLAAGDRLERAVTAGGAAASIAVTRRGASAAMPTWDEIAEVLAV